MKNTNIGRLASRRRGENEGPQAVSIECLPYADFIERYDRPSTLFYLDPPYLGAEGVYGPLFERADFGRLASLLKGIRGRFILSLNDDAYVRREFGAFRLQKVEATYTLNKNDPKRVQELLITN